MMGCAGLAFWVVILWGVVWECCFSGFIIIPLLSCIILLSVTFGCVTRQGLVIDPVSYHQAWVLCIVKCVYL